MDDDADVDLAEATKRLEAEFFRQHPQCALHQSGHLLVPAGVAVNLRDLAKATLGMRVTRWEAGAG